MSNLKNLEQIRKHYESELREKVRKYKGEALAKKEIDIFNCVGLDRVVLDIPLDKIISEKKEFIIKDSPYFEKLISGYHMKNHYCRLIFNPTKIIYGDNLLNTSTKEEFIGTLNFLQQHIKKAYKIEIDLMESTLFLIEVNKYIKLDGELDDYTDSFIQMNKKVLRGHFKRKFNIFKDWTELTYVGLGTVNKYIAIYDKSLEHFMKQIGEDNFKKLSQKEVKKICKRYKTPIRFETKLKKEPLWRVVPKNLTLKEFCEKFDYWVRQIYSQSIDEAGLTNINLDKVLDERNKRFVRAFKAIQKDHKRGFIGKFLKNHSFSSKYKDSIWGLDEFLNIFSDIGEDANQRYNWKRLGKKEFLEMDYQPKLDKKIKELVKKIELEDSILF
nr:hypothetical protein [uncultured Cetobacterium sp.]